MNDPELSSYSMMDSLGGHLQHGSIAALVPSDPNNSGSRDLMAEGRKPTVSFCFDTSNYSGVWSDDGISDDEPGYVHVHGNKSSESLDSDPGFIEDIAEIACPLEVHKCVPHTFAQQRPPDHLRRVPVLTDPLPPIPVELEGKRVVWGFEICDELFEHARADVEATFLPRNQHLVTNPSHIARARRNLIESYCYDVGLASRTYYLSQRLYRRPPGSSKHDIILFASETSKTVPKKQLMDELTARLHTDVEPRWIMA
jgi:hypothetical protein